MSPKPSGEPSIEPSVNLASLDSAGAGARGGVSRKKAVVPAPETFALTEESKAWARDTLKGSGVHVDAETERFLDYHRSKGNQYADWEAAWRNWIRKAAEMGTPVRGGAVHKTAAQERLERQNRPSAYADRLKAMGAFDPEPGEVRPAKRERPPRLEIDGR